MSDAKIIACPHCHKKNRVASAGNALAANCGSCKQALFVGKPVDLTSANFNTHAASEMPVVVDFWASWCGPCMQFAPVFEAAASQFEPRARFAKVDTQAQQELAGRFNIRSIPTLMVFKQGKELARLSGALPAKEFNQWLEQYC